MRRIIRYAATAREHLRAKPRLLSRHFATPVPFMPFLTLSRVLRGRLWLPLMSAILVATPWRLRAEPRPAETPPTEWTSQSTLSDGWEFVRGDLGGIWETLRSNERSLDLPVWSKVTLPHCVNATDAVDPDQSYYQGPSWYRRELDVNNPYAGGRTLLHFEGSGQKTTVFVGDRQVFEHLGGYDEFVVDITDAVNAYRSSPLPKLPAAEYRVTRGRIPLAVRCDNSRDLESIPSSLSDFNRYGGLYRPVHLVYVPDQALIRVHTTPSLNSDGTWSLALTGRFAAPNHSAPVAQAITIRVIDPSGKEVATAHAQLSASTGDQALPGVTLDHPQRWSPKNPAVYGVEVVAESPLGRSRVWDRFGLRSFEFVDHGPFKLNGERLVLHGTHRHEDHAGLGAAMTPELMEKEMRLMKAMGVNFIRLGHYQQSRRILELCDELGLLVWEEIPWCRGGLGGERYREQARAMLGAMIEQHHNHPSVILWGLGNENDWPGDFSTFDRNAIRSFMTELNQRAHTLDPTRLTALRRCDFCSDLVDVYSPSIWAGWYRGQFTEYRAVLDKERMRVKHMLHIEWGGDSHAGRHAEDPYRPLLNVAATGAADERGLDFRDIGGNARASRDGDWSETYICDLVDWHLKEQEKMDWLTGSAMWPFKDFSTPLRSDNPVPFMNQKGAVERDLTPKESYFVYQSYWSEDPMIHVYGHSWPVRWGKPGEPRVVKVYSNCEEAELWLNGVSQGVKHRDSQDFPAAGLRWKLSFQEGMNTLRTTGHRGSQVVTDEISFRYEVRPWGAPHHLRLHELPAVSGQLRVGVELLDAAGVVCLDSRDTLRFGHAGDGRLIDNLGTVRGSRVVQLTNGRAEICVNVPADGRAVVSASVQGIPTAWIALQQPGGQTAKTVVANATAKTASDLFRELRTSERERVLRLADEALKAKPVSLRSAPLPDFAQKAGAVPGDYLSMGDYWWPNPKTKDGLPYVRRDGESNPDNFDAHRALLREMRDHVAALAAAYLVTGDATYAEAAARWLHTFFVDPATRMNPHLRFAQAIPGITPGRGIGIIDTLHLVEVPLAVQAIAAAPGLPPATMAGVRAWFADYLQWMLTSANGREEAATLNNHSVAYALQAAVFARFVGNAAALNQTRQAFLERLLPGQLAFDGSFPRELARTKPYGYSIFQLDNIALLTEVLSTDGEDLWARPLADGRSVEQAVAFLYPYLSDRGAWPFSHDVAHFEAWPVRQPALLLAGYRLGRPEYLDLWRRLPADPEDLEVRRNMAVTQPLLWLLPATPSR
jgi:beta-galactosidase